MRGFRLFAIPLIFVGFQSLALPHFQQASSPSQVVTSFYKLLRQKQYVEGFKLSVYEGAVSTLAPLELAELQIDFDRTFANIPNGITIKGESVAGDAATVRIQLPGSKEEQTVDLIRVGGQWKVGDFETYNLVRQQGHDFFFNTRMYVNEHDVAEILKEMISSEILYAQNHKGRMAGLSDLVASSTGNLPKELAQGSSAGFRSDGQITNGGAGFDIVATPFTYGHTGKLSFFANAGGVHAQDVHGQAATLSAPFFQN